jgi:hypothetical protein
MILPFVMSARKGLFSETHAFGDITRAMHI